MERLVGTVLSAILSISLVPVLARAQLVDHLKVYRVASATTVNVGADLQGAFRNEFDETGCQISGGPKLLLVSTARTPRPPPAVPVGPSLSGRVYLCYRTRCQTSSAVPVPLPFTDQFGMPTLTSIRNRRMVCVPTDPPPNPCDQTDPPQCSSGTGCPPGQVCKPSGGSCACLPPTCAQTNTDQCSSGECPAGQACGFNGTACQCYTPCQPGIECGEGICLTAGETCGRLSPAIYCGCVPAGSLPCGDATAPECDGSCPSGTACISFGACLCSTPGVGPCGVIGPPECYGECPPEAPICRDVGGTCMCTP